MPPMSVLLAAGAAAEAVCTPPRAPQAPAATDSDAAKRKRDAA
ncbi:hypothetical protein ABZ746_33155 [Streptomyces sp. NPDC020096]